MQVKGGRRSPTAEERRRQIVAAAMEVLAESGYAQTSFARIAERAGISSTRLISYHFAGKEELLRAIAEQAKEAAVAFISPPIEAAPGPRAMLAAYITANLEFCRERPVALRALIEIATNAKAAFGEPYLPNEPQETLEALESGFLDGQTVGEFREFDPHVMATAVRAAIDTVALRYAADPTLDLDHFAAQLVSLFDRAVAAE
ncbi:MULTISPECIES: TetR/AcrR family transcriptional regulator [unclassified Nocardia]|uniref:TetR/AcrR family transcriptional regulator n=1 Tax=unclassified Nocardia TaxID=2637762 RepID=UPI001CE46BAD|nr:MULTISPECIES: TetR/AcrR family transcriptional regulator [unclassified Nocardia]